MERVDVACSTIISGEPHDRIDVSCGPDSAGVVEVVDVGCGVEDLLPLSVNSMLSKDHFDRHSFDLFTVLHSLPCF